MAMQMLVDMGNFAGVELGHRDELHSYSALQSTESTNRFHFSQQQILNLHIVRSF